MLKNPKDFWSGVMFAVIGFAFAIVVKVYDYPMGTASRMGAGYFPFVLGNVMGVLGLIIIGQALLSSGARIGKFAWQPLIWVLAGFVIFGLTAKLVGLVIAIVLLVVISSFGGHRGNTDSPRCSVALTSRFLPMYLPSDFGNCRS